MSAQHTPGPWLHHGEVNLVNDTHSLFCGGVNPVGSKYIGDICYIQSSDHINGVTREEAEANARLIASAPDLLEALENLQTQIQQVSDGDRPYTGFDTELIDEAIAKARGES